MSPQEQVQYLKRQNQSYMLIFFRNTQTPKARESANACGTYVFVFWK